MKNGLPNRFRLNNSHGQRSGVGAVKTRTLEYTVIVIASMRVDVRIRVIIGAPMGGCHCNFTNETPTESVGAKNSSLIT